ncbi:methyltransferase [Allosphingosinicella sp.]|jgi:methylase of polypeptide subunit release factors|uniref:methyltransferase n=1 Tax=Allosphingosinicella sp. TaxID=2823234 RepID=UPI002EFC3DE9
MVLTEGPAPFRSGADHAAGPDRAAVLTGTDSALLDLLHALRALDYRFVTVTPETHRRAVAGRPGKAAADLRDVFGWSLPFDPGALPGAVLDALERSRMIGRAGGLRRSRIRVSSLERTLFLHSAFPTEAEDSIFLGPDSYRFARFVRSRIPALGPVRRLVDIGAGAGVGAIAAAPLVPGARLTLTDVNPLALRVARINARFAGLEVETVEGPGLSAVEGPIDLAIANPPFVVDPAKRRYRDGGGMRGAAVSLEWAIEAARRIAPGGTVLLYTGSAITDGCDGLRVALEEQLPALGCSLDYGEIDPDIFGELIEEPGYEGVERIAAIGAAIRKG